MLRQTILTALLSALLVVIVAAPAAYMLMRDSQPAIGAVDLAQLIDEHEKVATLQLSKQGLTDAERTTIREQSQAFIVRLSQAIEVLPAECRCVVLNSAAILSGQVKDLTPLLRQQIQQ